MSQTYKVVRWDGTYFVQCNDWKKPTSRNMLWTVNINQAARYSAKKNDSETKLAFETIAGAMKQVYGPSTAHAEILTVKEIINYEVIANDGSIGSYNKRLNLEENIASHERAIKELRVELANLE